VTVPAYHSEKRAKYEAARSEEALT
jgi:hypothetical protein